MIEIFWTKNAAKELQYWKINNLNNFERIKELIEAIRINPFGGLGKPEPLRYQLKGCWSRRISGEHRLVYRVKNKYEVEILQCRFHYQR